MTATRLFTLIMLIMLCGFHANARTATDTLKKANILMKGRKYKQAEVLLAPYAQAHSTELNGAWLYGQCAYYTGHRHTFHHVYEACMKRFPDNYYLKLDYALKLTAYGEFKEALALFDLYETYDTTSPDVKMARGRIAYWQGHMNQALTILQDPVLQNKSYKKWTNELQDEIRLAKAFWIQPLAEVSLDDQPLQTYRLQCEGGQYHSPWFSPGFQANLPYFHTGAENKTGFSFIANNQWHAYRAGLLLKIGAGVSMLPNQTWKATGRIALQQKIWKKFTLDAAASYEPYCITRSSLQQTVMLQQEKLSLSWTNPHKLQGQVYGRLDGFPSYSNQIQYAGGWFLSPSFYTGSVIWNAGYSFAYSHATHNAYQADISLAQAITNSYNGQYLVAGSYIPFYTPLHLQTHSLLLNIKAPLANGGAIGVNAAIGVYGSNQLPYLFLDTTTSGAAYIHSATSLQKTYPDELTAYLYYPLNKKESFNIRYHYLRNTFYQSHTIQASWLIHFLHEQKKK